MERSTNQELEGTLDISLPYFLKLNDAIKAIMRKVVFLDEINGSLKKYLLFIYDFFLLVYLFIYLFIVFFQIL